MATAGKNLISLLAALLLVSANALADESDQATASGALATSDQADHKPKVAVISDPEIAAVEEEEPDCE